MEFVNLYIYLQYKFYNYQFSNQNPNCQKGVTDYIRINSIFNWQFTDYIRINRTLD